jgi:ketosteroid isomerase-like protein
MRQDETAIRELLAVQETAMRERDADRLVARYAPEIVLFNLAPPLGASGPEVLDPAGLKSWFAGFDGEIEYEITQPQVVVGGDVAYCHSLNRLSAVPRGIEYRFTLWFRSTQCFRRIGGQWLVTHEHTSTPFHMDGSFRAAVDLHP